MDAYGGGGRHVGIGRAARRRNRRRGVRAVALVAGIVGGLSVAPAASAQDGPFGAATPEPALAPGVQLTGFVGLLLPLSTLGQDGDSIQADLSIKPSYGATADVWLSPQLGLALTAGYTSPELSLSQADPVTGFPDSEDLGSVDYLHAEAVLVWRPNLRRSADAVLPYFGAGAGIRRLDFPDGSGFADASDVTLVLNGGVHLPISGQLHLRLDVRDVISSFDGPFGESNVQHDVMTRVGLGFGL